MTDIREVEELEEKFPNTRGKHFVQIWDFMVSDFKLKNTELMIYAIIFAMHRSYCECFTGSREYLQKWSGASKTVVDRSLASLEDKKLIRKEYRQYGQIKKAIYFVNTESLPTCEMFALENRHRDNMEKIRRANLKNKNINSFC